jgi:hypothetical protein
MNGFFTLVLQEVVLLADIAQTVLCTLIVVNVVLLVLISILLLRNVSSVFPTCPHASECGKLLHSLSVPILKKISNFYATVEKKMIALEDESVAKQNLELFEAAEGAHQAYEDQCSQGDEQDQIALLAGSKFADLTNHRQRRGSIPKQSLHKGFADRGQPGQDRAICFDFTRLAEDQNYAADEVAATSPREVSEGKGL